MLQFMLLYQSLVSSPVPVPVKGPMRDTWEQRRGHPGHIYWQEKKSASLITCLAVVVQKFQEVVCLEAKSLNPSQTFVIRVGRLCNWSMCKMIIHTVVLSFFLITNCALETKI